MNETDLIQTILLQSLSAERDEIVERFMESNKEAHPQSLMAALHFMFVSMIEESMLVPVARPSIESTIADLKKKIVEWEASLEKLRSDT